jgi:hypothetical protein
MISRAVTLLIAAASVSIPWTLKADSVVTDWNAMFLQAVRDSKLGPPMVARAAAILHTCIYDAWACYDDTANGTVYGGDLRRPLLERIRQNREQAIDYAAYRAMVDLFPLDKASYDAYMARANLNPADLNTKACCPIGIGNLVSAAVINIRHADGSNQLGDINGGAAYSDYTGYVPVNTVTTIVDPNHWQQQTFVDPNSPTGFTTPTYLGAQWGNVRPFALAFPSQLRPIAPALLPRGLALYRSQAAYLVRLTSKLTDRQKVIAEYWKDGPHSETPPGHWNLFAEQISIAKSFSLEQDVKLFFALGNAVMDASIGAWECKRHYDYVRPITAIHYLYRGVYIPTYPAGGGAAPTTVLGENWKPYQPDSFITPPFPEYCSGHSAFSASAAQILRSFLRTDRMGLSFTFPVGASAIEPNVVPAQPVTLTWSTFTAAANEAGMSRRYGGIHFPQGDVAARHLGTQAGKKVWAQCQRLWLGRE